MTRRKHDANQEKIVHALRQAGASVAILADIGHGLPDLLVGWHGHNILIEVKNLDGRGKRFTPEEQEFLETWRGQVEVVCNEWEALDLLE